MSVYVVNGLSLPVRGELDVNGHSVPILELKELPDKLREAPREDKGHDVSG